MRFVGSAAVLAVSSLVLAACGSTEPPEQTPPLPTPSGAYACPAGDLQIEGPQDSEELFGGLTASYTAACRNQNNVVWNGSEEGGATSFVNGLVAIGVSEWPLDQEETSDAQRRCLGSPAWHLPMMSTPVALVFRVDGIDSLTLSPETLAGIMSGRISTWDDPEIAEQNPGTDLPSQSIQVFSRSGRSGASGALSGYLAQAAPESWGTAKASTSWRGKGQAKNNPEQIVDAIRSTPGTIGYVEVPHLPEEVAGATPTPEATPQSTQGVRTTTPEATPPYASATPRVGSLGVIAIGEGESALKPTVADSRAAFNSLRPPAEGNDLRLSEGPIAEGYPIQVVTYQITCSGASPGGVPMLQQDYLRFLTGPDGQDALPAQGYVPLEQGLRDRVRGAVDGLG